MTNRSDNKKCSFGAFLDIVDDFQKNFKKPIPGKKEEEVSGRKCSHCAKTIDSDVKVCSQCGEEQPLSD